MENIISNVAVVFRGQRRHLMLKVAATLKQSHGSRLHVYCSNEVEAAFVRRSDEDGLFDTVTARGAILRDGLMTPESELNAKAVFAEARRYEALLGLPYNTLIVGDTGCGQGYAQAAYHWPRSPLHDGASYLQMLNAYNSVFAFWEREINDKQLTLLLNGDNVIGHVCRAFGVPFRFLEMARYRNYWFWAHNSYLEDAEIEHAYEAALIAPSEVDAIVDPYQAAPYEIAKLAMRDSLRNQTVAALLRNVARATVRQAYLWLRRPEKARNRTLAAEVRRHWRFWRDAQRMRDPSLARLADIRDTPYVFFGLQFEPENSIGQLSPEYFFQHAAIAALSRDLPAGVRLVVKEHLPAVGPRPDNFYDQIRDLKNVVILNMTEPGIEVVRHARAVATISGTSGFEAAAMGIPTICFGRHTIYNFLPHVFVARDEVRLKDYLEVALSPEFDKAQARMDGARFLKAIMESGVEMPNFTLWDADEYDSTDIAAAHRGLLRGLGLGECDRARQVAASVD